MSNPHMTDLRAHLRADRARVTECSRCLKVVKVNRRTLTVFGADDTAHLVANLDKVFRDAMLETHIEELAALWGHFGMSPPTKIKHYVPWMFEFSCETGMRTAELLRLRWIDVNWEGGWVYVLPSKNEDERHALLTERAEELLRGLPHTSECVFPVNSGTIGVEFRDGCKALGIQNLHFHDSRHEACSQLAKKLSVMELAAVIGHRDLKSLQIYYNPTPQELSAKLRAGSRSTPPRPSAPTPIGGRVPSAQAGAAPGTSTNIDRPS